MQQAPVSGRHRFRVWDSHLPPEFYGKGRSDVRLLAIDPSRGVYSSSPFSDVAKYLKGGDMLVFNNSLTVPSSIPVYHPGLATGGWLHIGTSRRYGMVLVEPRPRHFNAALGKGEHSITSPGFRSGIRLVERDSSFGRFYWADFGIGEEVLRRTLDRYGSAISYDHVPFKLGMDYYRTVFSAVPGSSEFPSASRPFTTEVMSSVRRKGIGTATLTLHCNLSPLEPAEFSSSTALLDEWFSIDAGEAERIEEARNEGGRIVAVGTSAVRALESSYRGRIRPGSGRTELFIRPGSGIKSVDGLITGLHDPDSSHIEMISAFMDDSLLRSAYSTALNMGYQWHEFGDLSLIL